MGARVLFITLLTSSLLVGCYGSKDEENLATLVAFAEITGTADGSTYDFSYGPKGEWCYEKSRIYIATVMGFDGSNGTTEMGEVQGAYRKACLTSY
jgi:hypothetical protein